MATLSFQTTPTYELTLSSNGKKIKYRPFIVKEEKILLMALQEGDENGIIVAIKEIISACTFGVLDVEKLPTVDVEYLFINLRNKSLGEGLDLEVYCTSCNAKNLITSNLEDIKIERNADVGNVFELSDELKISMQYPTLEMTYNIETKNVEQTIELISKCIEFIEYKGKLHECSTLPLSEVIEFVEHLTQQQLRKINTFFDSIPRTVFEDRFKCLKCSADNHIRVEGISSFFG